MNHSTRRTRRPPVWAILVLLQIAGLAGYYSPWIPHPSAGLAITGLDLAEYVKFVPEIASDSVGVMRELFLLPLLTGSVALSLLASRRGLPRLVRAILLIAALATALSMLPPAWTPQSLLLAEYRLQFLAIAICVAAILLFPVARLLPNRLVVALVVLLSLPSMVTVCIAFALAREPILALYQKVLPPGWGFWLWLGATLAGSTEALRNVVWGE